MERIAFFCLCLFFPALTVLAGGNSVSIATNEVPPFSGPTLKNQGVSIEIVTQAFKKSGYTATVRFYPWKRALQMAKKGHCDGITPIWYTSERTKWYLYSDRLHTPNIIGIFAPSGITAVIKRYADLRPYHIGYVMGFAYDQSFFDNLDNFNAIYFYSPFDLMTALIKGEIQMAIIGKYEGNYFLQNQFPESRNNFQFLGHVIEKRNHYLAISKKAKDHEIKLAAFNRGLAALIKEGSLKKILAAHKMGGL